MTKIIRDRELCVEERCYNTVWLINGAMTNDDIKNKKMKSLVCVKKSGNVYKIMCVCVCVWDGI